MRMRWIIVIFLLVVLSFGVPNSQSTIHLPPELNSPGDFSYTWNETDNIISWVANANEVNDEPLTYSIYVNNLLHPVYQEIMWQDGVAIDINVDYLPIGSNNVTIEVKDTGYPDQAQSAIDTVMVEVLEPSQNIINVFDQAIVDSYINVDSLYNTNASYYLGVFPNDGEIPMISKVVGYVNVSEGLSQTLDILIDTSIPSSPDYYYIDFIIENGDGVYDQVDDVKLGIDKKFAFGENVTSGIIVEDQVIPIDGMVKIKQVANRGKSWIVAKRLTDSAVPGTIIGYTYVSHGLHSEINVKVDVADINQNVPGLYVYIARDLSTIGYFEENLDLPHKDKEFTIGDFIGFTDTSNNDSSSSSDPIITSFPEDLTNNTVPSTGDISLSLLSPLAALIIPVLILRAKQE